LGVVGAGINATYENVRRGSRRLLDHRIATFGLATSSFRTTWLVQRTELDDAVRLLHVTFIERTNGR
jgi:aspartate kinase